MEIAGANSIEETARDRATILVVDDAPESLLQLSSLLQDEYEVRALPGGARVQAVCREQRPDLILLDIVMPDPDGFEVLKRLRADPATAGIPVIFLTSLNDPGDESRGLSLGAIDYVTKPISPPILLARVRNHLELVRRGERMRAMADKLSRYLSPQVYQSIFEGRQEVEVSAKRKTLTIFFSDIQSFTQTTDEMEPEDLTWLINDYFSEMSAIAAAHGATIDKFIGDAMVMFFGDPETRGERGDALQCVRMAVAMQRRMAALQQKWATRGFNKPFHMRVGIHTGFCNVGNFGSARRMDYTIIGGAVNLAARLQQMGDPDGIMLSYKTYALVSPEFAADEREPLHAKGFAREIRCFALRDVLEDRGDAGRVIEMRRPGLALSLDLSRVAPEDARLAAIELERAATRLRNHDEGAPS